MRWVEADESRESLLDEVLGLIRFPTMDYEELGLVGKHHIAAGAGILKVSQASCQHIADCMLRHTACATLQIAHMNVWYLYVVCTAEQDMGDHFCLHQLHICLV